MDLRWLIARINDLIDCLRRSAVDGLLIRLELVLVEFALELVLNISINLLYLLGFFQVFGITLRLKGALLAVARIVVAESVFIWLIRIGVHYALDHEFFVSFFHFLTSLDFPFLNSPLFLSIFEIV